MFESSSLLQRQQIRVLIVEDEFLVTSMLRDFLEEAGCKVVGLAADHHSAVSAAISAQPDLAVMDIKLAKGTDGVAAALEIFDRTGVRSIFASASVDAETMRMAETAKPIAWVKKPYRPEDVVAAIASL